MLMESVLKVFVSVRRDFRVADVRLKNVLIIVLIKMKLIRRITVLVRFLRAIANVIWKGI